MNYTTHNLLKIARLRACRFDSGRGHHLLKGLTIRPFSPAGIIGGRVARPMAV